MVEAKQCCICERQIPSWNDPEPVRDPLESCCADCNHFIVGAARRESMTMSKEERDAFFKLLQASSFQQLCERFGVSLDSYTRFVFDADPQE